MLYRPGLFPPRHLQPREAQSQSKAHQCHFTSITQVHYNNPEPILDTRTSSSLYPYEWLTAFSQLLRVYSPPLRCLNHGACATKLCLSIFVCRDYDNSMRRRQAPIGVAVGRGVSRGKRLVQARSTLGKARVSVRADSAVRCGRSEGERRTGAPDGAADQAAGGLIRLRPLRHLTVVGVNVTRFIQPYAHDLSLYCTARL